MKDNGELEDTKLQRNRVGIVGLGYVGLPLALLFAEKDFTVTGIDSDEKKILKINSGESYLPDIEGSKIQSYISGKKFKVTTDYEAIRSLDIIIVCVPTPLSANKTPDLSFLNAVGNQLSPRIKKDQLIILESSTFPGTTREIFQPLLEKSGLKVGQDIYLGYSPERIDPGNKKFNVKEVPKIVSGVSNKCLEKIVSTYGQVFEKLVPVSSPEVAEFTKLLENSYRYVNISFINEMAILCDTLKINLWEAIGAANSKPYGFTPFYPGPGAGGHCIPVDPLYLVWKSNQYGYDSKMIRLSDEINDFIPEYIVKNITSLVPNIEKKRVLICGITYKKDVNDLRESPSLKIINELEKLGAVISYHDPYIPEININNHKYSSMPLTEDQLKQADCVVILTDHTDMPIQKILNHSSLVYDLRNVTSGLSGNAKVLRFGGGKG